MGRGAVSMAALARNDIDRVLRGQDLRSYGRIADTNSSAFDTDLLTIDRAFVAFDASLVTFDTSPHGD